MKNLPEHEAFRALEKRLANYTEEPDDDLWQKIAGEIPSRKPAWAPWLNRASAVAVVVALGWAVMLPARQGNRMLDDNGLVGKAQRKKTDSDVKTFAIEKRSAAGENALAPERDMQRITSVDEQQEKERTVKGTEHASRSQEALPASGPTTAGQPLRGDNSVSGGASSSKVNSKRQREAEFVASASGQSSAPGRPIKSSGENSGLKNIEEEALASSAVDSPPAEGEVKGTTIASRSHAVTNGNTPPDTVHFAQPVQKVDSAAAAPAEHKEPFNKKRKKKTPLTVYALLTPSVSFQTVSPLSQDAVVIQKFSNPSMFSGDRLGFSFEAGIQGRLTEKLEYVGGLSFYHQSQTLQYTYQTGKVTVESGGDDLSFVATPETAQKSFHYSMQNIGVQAGLLYTLKEQRLSHKVGVMLQFQEGLAKASEGEAYNNAASNYLNYQLLYRVELEIDSRLKFIFQPSLGRTLKANESLDAPFTLKQYRPGIGIGLIYGLERRRK